MKIRSDFVTNSSSSSFILAFDTKKDYERFNENCEWLGYEQLSDFVRNKLKSKLQSEHKEDAIDLLKWSLEKDKYMDEITKEKFPEYPDNKSIDMWFKIQEYKRTEEYALKLKGYLNKDKDYKEKSDRINNAYKVVKAEIWDTNGGIFEWAVRHGFLQNECWQYLVLQWDVG